MGLPGQPSQFPLMHPGFYSPGQMAFNNNPDLSQLISLFSGQMMSGMFPGAFVPHMSHTQMLVDQFASRNHQRQAQGSMLEMTKDNDADVTNRLLGIRSLFTNEAPSELNREQARNMAGMINNPFLKPMLGSMIGAENLEAILHGSKGDVHALSNTLNRVGYFRQDPSGTGRMDSESLTDYNRGVYAHMYEPQGNIKSLEARSRDASDVATQTAARTQLKKAAYAEHTKIVEDEDVVGRLEGMEESTQKVEALYKKYVAGGKATTMKQQAQELSKIEDAVAAAGVLKEDETTVGGLVSRAKIAPTHEMHGFMAGQVGQIAENMFQRGMIPQAVGAMSAADRVKLIGETQLDDETLTRLSKEMARRDFSRESNSSEKARRYRGLESDEERDAFIEKESKDYIEPLKATRSSIEAAAAGKLDPQKISDLEKMQGFDALASNVDAKRSAEAIKKYAGAVDAIKDIFGDNGNPNAPMPALLAALEGLTGGAMGAVKADKIASTLRQMQTTAKEAGIGFEQMAAMSSQIDSSGQMLGLTPADTLRIKGASMAAVKVMQDSGAFSNPTYGKSDKGTTTQLVSQLMTQGAASRVSKSMAALAGIYEMDDKDPATGKSRRFANSRLEKALEAYRNNEGDGTFSYVDKDGKTVTQNIRKLMAEQGEAGAVALLTESGGTNEEYTARRDDPLMMQYSNNMFAFLAQKEEEVMHVKYGDTKGRLMGYLKDTTIMQGKSKEEQSRIGDALADTMTRMIMDTAGDEPKVQMAKMQAGIEQKFFDVFSKDHPDNPDEARRKAKEAAAAVSSSATLSTLAAGAGQAFHMITGRNMAETSTFRANNTDSQIAAEASRAEKRGEVRKLTDHGHETNSLARASDYANKIGESGGTFVPEDFVKHTADVTTDKEIMLSAAKGMTGAFDELSDLKKEALIKNSDVDAAVKSAKAGDDSVLRKYAGVSKDLTVVTDEDVKTRREDRLKNMSDEELTSLHQRFSGRDLKIDLSKIGDADQKKKVKDSMALELRNNAQFQRQVDKELLTPQEISQQELTRLARANVGSAHEGREQDAENIKQIQKALLGGSNQSTLRPGVHAALRATGVDVDDAKMAEIFAAVSDTTPEGKQRLETLVNNLPADNAQKKKLGNFLTGFQAGVPLELGRTTGLSEITDRELTKELTATYAQQLPADKAATKARETITEIAKQQKEAEQAGTAAKTTAEKKQQVQKQIATDLEKHYATTMTPDVAKETAEKKAAELVQNTEKTVAASVAATAGAAGDARQARVDVLEVNAQTVVIKNGKIEGGGSGDAIGDLLSKLLGGKPESVLQTVGDMAAKNPEVRKTLASVASGDPQAMLESVGGLRGVLNLAREAVGNDGASLMDTATEAVGGDMGDLLNSVGGLETVARLASGDFSGAAVSAAKKFAIGSLTGRAPEEKKPGEEKPDVPLAPPEPPPAHAAPEPEKVADNTASQLVKDSGGPLVPVELPPTPQQSNESIDFDKWHGKAFKIVTTPPGKSAASHTDSTPIADEPGRVSIVTPENGDAWNWPDAPQETIDNFRSNWSDIQGGIGGYKMDQIRRGMAAAESATASEKQPPETEALTPAQKAAEELVQAEDKRNKLFAELDQSEKSMLSYNDHKVDHEKATARAEDTTLPAPARRAAKLRAERSAARKDQSLQSIAMAWAAEDAGLDISGSTVHAGLYHTKGDKPEKFLWNDVDIDPNTVADGIADLKEAEAKGETLATDNVTSVISAEKETEEKETAAKAAGVSPDDIAAARKKLGVVAPPKGPNNAEMRARYPLTYAYQDKISKDMAASVANFGKGGEAIFGRDGELAASFDAAARYNAEAIAPNENQYLAQEGYAQAHINSLTSPTPLHKEAEENQKTNNINLLGQHAAAREAGIDTSRGIDYDPHASTINGFKVDKKEIERHTLQLTEAAEKDPLAIVSDDVQRKLKIGKYDEKATAKKAVEKANDKELEKVTGASSANVDPADAARVAGSSPEQKSSGQSASKPTETPAASSSAASAAEAGKAAAQTTPATEPLAAALPDPEMTKPSAAPINRVQAMAADMPTVAPGTAGGGGSPAGMGSNGHLTINGTLTLSGLQEAILSGRGAQVMQTEGGAPIVVDPPMQAKTPAPTK